MQSTHTGAAEIPALLAHWGVTGITEVRETASEVDRTTLVRAASGDVVLKVSPLGSTVPRMQVALLAAAAAGAPTLPVPRLLTDARTGTPLDASGTTFVSTLLPGAPLEDAQLGDALIDAIADAQTALLTALSAVDAAAAGVPASNDWSIDSVLRHAPLIDRHLDPARAAIAHRTVTAYEQQVAPAVALMPARVLHADFNLSNLLVTGDELSGIIDFADAVTAPRIFDVAVTAAYLALREGSVTHPMVQRYLDRMTASCALTADELALVPTLVLARAVLVLVLGRETAADSPDRAEYALRYDTLAERLLVNDATHLPPTDHPHGKKHQ